MVGYDWVILDFQYCNSVLDFLHYFFNILFYFIKKHFPDCLTTLNPYVQNSQPGVLFLN